MLMRPNAPAASSVDISCARSAIARPSSAACAASASGWPAAHASSKAQPAASSAIHSTASLRAHAAAHLRAASRFGIAGRVGTVARPDGIDRRIVEPRPARGSMRAQHHAGQCFGRQAERARRRRVAAHRARRVRLGPEAVEPRHAGQIGQLGGRLEAREEVCEIRAVAQQRRVASGAPRAHRSPPRRETIPRRRGAPRQGNWPAARRCSPS